MATREYGTDPYGIIARGVPGGQTQEGPSITVGGVGTPVYSLVSPGQSFGTGIGAGLRIPLNKEDTPDVKKKAKGGKVKKMASGGSASKRGDGIAQKGKTRGKMC